MFSLFQLLLAQTLTSCDAVAIVEAPSPDNAVHQTCTHIAADFLTNQNYSHHIIPHNSLVANKKKTWFITWFFQTFTPSLGLEQKCSRSLASYKAGLLQWPRLHSSNPVYPNNQIGFAISTQKTNKETKKKAPTHTVIPAACWTKMENTLMKQL